MCSRVAQQIHGDRGPITPTRTICVYQLRYTCTAAVVRVSKYSSYRSTTHSIRSMYTYRSSTAVVFFFCHVCERVELTYRMYGVSHTGMLLYSCTAVVVKHGLLCTAVHSMVG